MRITARRHVGIATAAAAALVGVHALSKAASLTETDSINLALALGDFDVRLHHPHPPGYPLVVAVAHVFDWFADPVQAYLLVTALASVGAVAATFLLGRELFDARAGATAAMLLVASPLVLYYASIVSVYPAEVLFGPLVVFVAHRVARGADHWSALALAPVLALAAGFRPTALGLLLPVCAVAVWIGRPKAGDLAIGACIGAVVVAAWAVPMLLASGGIDGYREASSLYGRAASFTSLLYGASFGEARHNAIRAMLALLLAAVASLLLLLVAAARRSIRITGQTRWLLLGAWVLPYLVLYVVVHFGKPGYALACVPAFAVAAAGAVANERLAPLFASLLAAVAVAFFLFAPTPGLGTTLDRYRAPAFIPTADSIRVQDEEAQALPRIARACPRPTCTIVSLGTAHELWEHDPWSLSRWYSGDARVVRLADLKGEPPPGSSARWIGGRIPAIVAQLGRHVETVGLWEVYETRGEITNQVVSGLFFEEQVLGAAP